MAVRKDSFTYKVLQVLRTTPELANRTDNEELYKAVGAETASRKSVVRMVKKKFKRGEYDAPPGWNSHRSPTPEAPPLEPSIEASVFKVSGKGTLTDKVVEYFKENSHKLEDADNTEVYEAVGADDANKKSAVRIVKMRLKKAVRESGAGVVVVVNVQKDSVEAMEEFKKELETIEVKLSPRQKKIAEIFNRGNTQIKAVMEVYDLTYEKARHDAHKYFQSKNVLMYLSELERRDEAENTRIRREMLEKDRQVVEASDLGNFVNWKGDKSNLKPIVDDRHTIGLKKFKVTTNKVITNKANGDKISSEQRDVEIAVNNVLRATKQTRESLREPFHNSSAYSGDLEIRELWERFRDQTREDSLSVRDLVNELTARDCEIKPALIVQLNHELARMEPEPPGDDGVDPEDFTFEKLNEEKKKLIGDYKEHYKTQQEEFLPRREKEIQEIAAKHGFDRKQKPLDTIIKGDDEIDPPFKKDQDGAVGEDSGV